MRSGASFPNEQRTDVPIEKLTFRTTEGGASISLEKFKTSKLASPRLQDALGGQTNTAYQILETGVGVERLEKRI